MTNPISEPLTNVQRDLVVDHMKLARRLAMIAWAKNREVQDPSELVSVAFVGLVTAAARFDPSRPDIIPGDVENGKAFAGYARQRITGAILDWQRSKDHVPRRTRQIYRDAMSKGLGDGVGVDVLAEKLGITKEALRQATQAVDNTPLTLDIDPEEHESSQAVIVASEVDVESEVFSSQIMSTLALCWANLDPDDRLIIANRFYYGQTLGNIAILLDRTTPEVRERMNELTAYLKTEMQQAAAH